MRARAFFVALLGATLVPASATSVAARQMDHTDHTDHAAPADSAVGATTGGMPGPSAAAAHGMLAVGLPGGWTLSAMGQAFPIVTAGLSADGSPLRETSVYLTQPAVMGSLRSPGSRVALRLTLNFEGLTQERGELNYGGWGEGFIDKRHPHALVHEAMLSMNFPGSSRSPVGAPGSAASASGGGSISLGRGFAPYGTDDPMGRPGLKYPTNHHLSQILERWTVNGQYVRDDWSFEAGLFAGAEPEGPYDLANTAEFGRSWSARVIRRWTPGSGEMWEVGASRASVSEVHDGERERARLTNVSLRYERVAGAGGHAGGSDDTAAPLGGGLYGLLEFSVGGPEHISPYHSTLMEAGITRGPHMPYVRVERATRPEYPRDSSEGDGFFRYDHDAEAQGATAWWILNVGYGFAATTGAVAVRPFVDVQWHRVARERGDPAAVPAALSGASLWAVSIGARIHLGGGPMRMGSYGLLDAMAGQDHAGMQP